MENSPGNSNNFTQWESEDFELEEDATRSLIRKILYGVVAFLTVLGLLYISGIRQYFFYRRTPATIEQEHIGSTLDVEEISLPLTVFILVNDESNGSERSEENAMWLIENSSRIWQQANINLKTEKIVMLDTSDTEINNFLINPQAFIQNVNGYDYETVNVFLVKPLGGINGIAFSNIRSVAVADYTTVYDFRALAHEIGHVLGLAHTSVDKGSLMYRGANGFSLSLEEITSTRERANFLFGI